MKWGISFFVVLLFAVAIGLAMHLDSGYVLISYHTWTVETTLWFLILAVIALFVLLYFLLKIFKGVGFFSRTINNWQKQKKILYAQRSAQKGLSAWHEGRWELAEKLFRKSANNSPVPLLNSIMMAKAAQKLGRLEKRDEYLRRAAKKQGKHHLAIMFVKAKLQLYAKQYEEALASLTLLKQKLSGSAYLMQLLRKTYEAMNDWKGIEKLLPDLKKHKVFELEELTELEVNLCIKLLSLAEKNGIKEIYKVWNKIPSKMQKSSELLFVYTSALLRKNGDVEVEKILAKAISKNWDKKLVENYGKAKGADPTKQLTIAEGWLKAHENSSVLLLCLGRLCRRQKLWGKAQYYLDASARLLPGVVVYKELAEVMDALGNSSAALCYYREGIKEAAKNL